jgi:hypothetical protein
MNDPYRGPALTTGTNAGISYNVWDYTELAFMSRLACAMDNKLARYAFHRTLRFAARLKIEELFDDLAQQPVWRAYRLNTKEMIIEADGLFVLASGGVKRDYCSFYFRTWADSLTKATEAHATILACVGANQLSEPTMFSINWQFLTGKGELQGARIEEVADDLLYDEAYPGLEGGVNDFIRRYLKAPEPVLVLQGPPGTGKTRLIRALLGEMSRRNGRRIEALYTGEMKAMESDELFVRFITGNEQVFVVEDADYLLRPRASGNTNLHRFLTLADGIVRAQGRKIIFSTNLPNIGDLDDALVRPGRCFARLMIRNLSAEEACALLVRLGADNIVGVNEALSTIRAAEKKVYSLAEVYGMLRQQQKFPSS